MRDEQEQEDVTWVGKLEEGEGKAQDSSRTEGLRHARLTRIRVRCHRRRRGGQSRLRPLARLALPLVTSCDYEFSGGRATFESNRESFVSSSPHSVEASPVLSRRQTCTRKTPSAHSDEYDERSQIETDSLRRQSLPTYQRGILRCRCGVEEGSGA